MSGPTPQTKARKTNGKDKLTKARAQALLKAEHEATVKACLADIKAVCKRHACDLFAVPRLIPSGNGQFSIAAELKLVPSPEPPT